MEKEQRYKEALATAQDIDTIENVMIQTVTTQIAFSSVIQGLENGDYVIPRFQRMYRWNEKQVEELAISLLRGMPIPPIYCYRNRERQIVILDGQQRILSLYFYYIGKFIGRKKNTLTDSRKIISENVGFLEQLEDWCLIEKTYSMKYMRDFEEKAVDITYKNLSERLKRKINLAPITFVEIIVDSDESKEKMLHKIFANLNMGGTPLSSQELRNGIYGCKFYDMLYEINDTCKKWRYLYSGNPNAEINRESKDVELLLKMCTFKYYVKKKGEEYVLTEYKGKIPTLMDNFSKKAKEFEENEIMTYRTALLDFFESIEEVKGRNKDWALVSMFVVWDSLENKPYISKQRCEEIISSEEYRNTIVSDTSRKNRIEKRLRSVYEQLSKYD